MKLKCEPKIMPFRRFFRTAMFAAYKRSAQRRKSAAVEPHIKHLIEVAQLISAANTRMAGRVRYDRSGNASTSSDSAIQIQVRRWRPVPETTLFQVHQPELAEEADEGQEARLEQGHEVGLLAQSRFPGGVLVGFEKGIDDALAITAALMDDSSVPAIFEATFQHSNLLVRVDILQRRPGNRWRLIEVKSSVEVKPHHLYDHRHSAPRSERLRPRHLLGLSHAPES